MGKKTLFFCIFFSILSGFLFAGGNRDGNVARAASDPSGFTDSVDITGNKTGKHNYYLEARDNAGNITRSGPENIFVDPASDLPRATIINPMPNMYIQGNTNLVGIAFDDDGVDHVELSIRRGSDGRGEEILRVRARGSDYWSYFLDTTDSSVWTDGVYTITAWAVDINGLSGVSESFHPRQHRKHQVSWVLDRRKPETIVTSHEVGALAAGRVRLRGTVADGNGISSFRYSLDGGDRYTQVRTSRDRRTGNYNWEINFDSKRFEDGPAVIWFKAEDACGSEGTAAHLLFVNNTPPEVGIVYPEPDTVLNGIFSIAGYARHPVGIKRVTWKAGRAQGTFEMLPGNSWYSADIDLRGERTSNVEVEIRAEDVSGNVTVARQRYTVNQNADLPTVTLSEPTPGLLDNPIGLIVKGVASDDDGVASVFYSINGRTPVEIPCSGNFMFAVPNIPEGNNNVFEIWAKDITGVTGPKVAVRGIAVAGALPRPRITTLTSGAGGRAAARTFYSGIPVTLEPRVRTTIEVSIPGTNLASATISFAGQNPSPVRPSGGKATVQVPETLSGGMTEIELRATDRVGREVIHKEYIYVVTGGGGYGSTGSLVWVRPNELPDGRILLGSEETLLGLDGSGKRIVSARLTGYGSENINVEVDQYGRAALTPIREGSFGPFTLAVTADDSSSYNSNQFRLAADFRGPVVTINQSSNQNQSGGFFQNSAPVNFNITSANRISTVEYSLNMGDTWTNLISASEAASLRVPVNADITRTINIQDMEDGAVTILIRAVNDIEKSGIGSVTVLKDTEAPRARLIMPVSEARVNGTIRIGFEIIEKNIRRVSYNRPATGGSQSINTVVYDVQTSDKDYPPRFLEVLMDSIAMPLANNMRFVFEDRAGNRSEVSAWDFVIDREMDIPVAHIILPLDDEVITTDFIVSGIMFDDDAISKVYYRIDNGTQRSVEAANGFSIPITLSSLTDNDHSVTVIAEDIYGVRSEPVTRNFRVSLSEPTAEMTLPLFDTILKDTIEIRGTTSDANGVMKLGISLDNGNTFNQVHGTGWGNPGTTARPATINWNYSFNTNILKDGPHVVFLRVEDRYGIPATYAGMINIDNTAPEIILDSPGDGSISVGRISVMGRALDPNLESISVEMRSLEGANVPSDLRLRRQEVTTVIKDNIDVSRLSDGHYNIVVVAADKAGNVTRTSRNFELARRTFSNVVEVYYPLDNENVSGEFILYGYAGGTDPAGTVTIRINGRDLLTNTVDDSGFWRFVLDGGNLLPGTNAITVSSNFGGNASVRSRNHNLIYSPEGPWVTIDSFNFGDFAFERPYLSGRTGYILSAEDRALLADRSTDRETRDGILAKQVDFTEVSFDNGKTFELTRSVKSADADFRYRLETGDMAEGMHYILVRTTMKNGETAVTRMLVQVDKTPPVIRLISPEAGGRYNVEIAYSASATDDVELASLTYHLRVGDKAAYEVPGFLQGLYIEGVIPPFIKQAAPDVIPNIFAGGSTYTDFGLGLSFFDDNVKIQVQYGMLTDDLWVSLGGQSGTVRYGGQVLGLKLLASVYRLPFGSFAGPDWEWLSATFALGANFSLFDIAREGYTQSGQPTWMSALLLQIEFPRVTLPKREFLRTFSLFTEGQLWFVPTDVDAAANNIETIIPHIIVGLRLYIF